MIFFQHTLLLHTGENSDQNLHTYIYLIIITPVSNFHNYVLLQIVQKTSMGI